MKRVTAQSSAPGGWGASGRAAAQSRLLPVSVAILLLVLTIITACAAAPELTEHGDADSEAQPSDAHDSEAQRELARAVSQGPVDDGLAEALRERGPYPLAGGLYTYHDLVLDIHALVTEHRDLIELDIIGRSVTDLPIWSLRLGHGAEHLIVVASLHGNEWINSPLVMGQIAAYAQYYRDDHLHNGTPVRDLLATYTIHVVPMANPDGATLAQHGVAAFPERQEELLAINGGDDFRFWKANIRGVDLNRNFDGGQQGEAETREGVGGRPFSPAPAHAFYGGPAPESEPETRALVTVVQAYDAGMVLDYHSRGRVLFWHHDPAHAERDQAIAAAIQQETGYEAYPLDRHPRHTTLNRWATHAQGIPAIVVESTPFVAGQRDVSGMATMEEFEAEMDLLRDASLAAIIRFHELRSD